MAHIYSICDLSRLFAIIVIMMIKAYWAKHLLGYHSLALVLVLPPLERRWYILAERCLCWTNLLKYLLIFDGRTSCTTYLLLTLKTFFLYGTIHTLCLFLNLYTIFPYILSQIRSWLSFFQRCVRFILVVALGSPWLSHCVWIFHYFCCWELWGQIGQLWLLCHSYSFLDKRLLLSWWCSCSLLQS